MPQVSVAGSQGEGHRVGAEAGLAVWCLTVDSLDHWGFTGLFGPIVYPLGWALSTSSRADVREDATGVRERVIHARAASRGT